MNTAKHIMTACYSTLEFYDTGQSVVDVAAEAKKDLQLGVIQHDIHRLDEATDGTTENVMSTLKSFPLRVGLLDGRTATPVASNADGVRLKATLVYETGNVVEDLSATLEPPLLGSEAALESGIASFKLRITVLSSLCRGNRFRVQVTCAERPELNVLTAPMRTITKLKRGPPLKVKDKNAKLATPGSPITGIKRAHELESFLLEDLEACGVASGLVAEAPKPEHLDELWEEVSSNGSLLLELQKQQRALFRELRELREKACA